MTSRGGRNVREDMIMKHEIVWRDGCLEVKTHGDATVEGMAAMIAGILSHERWQCGGAVLVDNSELNAGALTVAQIRSIADMASQGREQVGTAKIAHLVARDLEFGLVRMWEALVSQRWDARLMCFRSRDEAVAWLKQRDGEGGPP
jgi:hypothetical protein